MFKKYCELLRERGVTTSEVCKAADINESAMSMWKKRSEEWDGTSKKPTPSLETVAKLAKYFGKPIEYFLEE